MIPDSLVTTGNDLPGHRILAVKGIAKGITVRSPTIVQGFFGGFQQLFGGNLSSFTEMCDQARTTAYRAMIVHAFEMGGNSVIGVRFDTSSLGDRAGHEVLCYGTSVTVELTAAEHSA
jgi:uncharacterized protein YbjQ (UPF0145 family)